MRWNITSDSQWNDKSDSYPWRLVFGKQAVGVKVEVMFVGTVLSFTKTIDVVWGETGGNLKEQVGECEAWQGRVPSGERERQQMMKTLKRSLTESKASNYKSIDKRKNIFSTSCLQKNNLYKTFDPRGIFEKWTNKTKTIKSRQLDLFQIKIDITLLS